MQNFTIEMITPIFNEEFYLTNNPDVAEAVNNGTIISGAEHFLSFGLSEGRTNISPLFNEEFYLTNNPDVAEAVNNGTIISGLEHFLSFGFNEGRTKISALFKEEFYLTSNPDVADAVNNGIFSSGLEHFLSFGLNEGRANISALFNEEFYLTNNPDVAEAVNNGTIISGLEHFLSFGFDEGRSNTSPVFNEEFYLENNPDVAEAVNNGTIISGLEHFLSFGFNEGRTNISPLFNEEFYLTNNPDVAEAVNQGSLSSGLEHFLCFGFNEGRGTLSLADDVILPPFNEEFYLENNPDVAEAVNQGIFSSGLEHFLSVGFNEGRTASSVTIDFDEQFYLTNNPDVAEAVSQGIFSSGLEHFLSVGFNEGRTASSVTIDTTNQVDSSDSAPTSDQVDSPNSAPTSDQVDSPDSNPTSDQVDSPDSNPTSDQVDSPDSAPTSDQVDSPDSAPTSDQVDSPDSNQTLTQITATQSDTTLSFSESLTASQFISLSITGLEASQPFIAFTDNSTSNVDTLLGVRNEDLSIIDSDDNSGEGSASRLSGLVNADGTINLSVTGASDSDFEGNHTQSGEFDLFISLNTTDTIATQTDTSFDFSDSLTASEVISFSITGLEASQSFVAYTDNRSSGVDTILGVREEDFSIMDFDNDSGEGLASALSGSVNADGTINLSVTGASDSDFEGNHTQSGEFGLFVVLGTTDVVGTLNEAGFSLSEGSFSSSFSYDLTLNGEEIPVQGSSETQFVNELQQLVDERGLISSQLPGLSESILDQLTF